MDAFSYYTYATAGWLAVQAIPLIMSPKLMLTMLSSDVRHVTSLEAYLSRSLGFALIALASVTILLRNAPLSSESVLTSSPGAPYAFPVLVTTFLYHAAVTAFSYVSYLRSKQSLQAAGMLLSALVGLLGGWCILFGQGTGHISRRSGADKRTSGFPFKNAESEKKKLGKI